MRFFKTLVCFGLLVSLGISAAAAGEFRLGAYGGTVIPAGDFTEVAAIGGGGGLSLGYLFTDAWMVYFQGSYHNFGSRKIYSDNYNYVAFEVNVIPVELGLSYFWGEPSVFQGYVTGRVGGYMWRGDHEDEDIGVAVGGGVSIPIDNGGKWKIYVEPMFHVVFGEETSYTINEQTINLHGTNFYMGFYAGLTYWPGR